MKRVVIVGGGGTGDYTAFTLRKKGFDGEITILSADHDRPYDRPYLSKEFLRGEIETAKVYLHAEADYEKERIDLRLEQRVSGGSLRERPGDCPKFPRPRTSSRYVRCVTARRFARHSDAPSGCS